MGSVIGPLLVAVVAFIMTFGIVVIAGSVLSRTERDKSLRRRVLGSVEADRAKSEETPTGWQRLLPATLVAVIARSMSKGGADEDGPPGRVEGLLERAGWAIAPAEFVAAAVLIGMTGAVAGSLLGGSMLTLLAGGGLAATAPFLLGARRGRKRLEQMQSQLPDTLTVIATSLRAGHSFLQSLEAVTNEAPEPSASEFKRTVNEIKLGRDDQDALEDMAGRVGSEDLRWTVLAIGIQREVGGNLAEVLDTVAETIREREQVRRQVDVLSAEGRLSMAVLSGLPIVMALYMSLVNPGYVGLLVTTQLGIAMLLVGSTMWVLGLIWMKKVVRIDV